MAQSKEPTHPLVSHNEGPHVLFGSGCHIEIDDVITPPSTGRFIPPDRRSLGIPGLSLRIAGGPVI